MTRAGQNVQLTSETASVQPWYHTSSLLPALARYRTIAYLATFFSGACSLTFQVVWQRYLSFMVGSEARSISLVVAVFLLGLAAGYRFWGNFTARGWTRRTMLKAVGYIELTIAGYALVFPSLFPLVRDLSYMAPNWFGLDFGATVPLVAIDFGATALLVFFPTFLMGASIPLLTAAIPDTMPEVNHCHTRIYGINTLGAFVGTFAAGFFLVPLFGLTYSIIIAALLNIAVGLAFLFNTLEGDIKKGEETPSIPNRFGANGIYLFVFITGTVTIAFEVLFMRVLSLAIGSGHYIFPIVVGIVILGLAIGSLSIRRGSVTANRVIYELVKLGVLLVAVYLTVPFWPYWISHIRVSMTTLPSNYPIFLGLIVLFMMVILLPVVIPMGRLLPMGYSLIDKDSDDYGRMCGRVYFSNTVGTVVGAVGIGYMLLIWLNVDQIFVMNIAMIFVLAAYLSLRQRIPSSAAVCGVLAGLVLLMPYSGMNGLTWNRHFHVQGLFRASKVLPLHFQGVFAQPEQGETEVLYFNDDPSVTVGVTRLVRPDRGLTSISIFVNGKSDGNTIADYSNMSLTGILPYLYTSKERDVDAAVIGLGMGITSGALVILDDVREVVTLEISSSVIEAAEYFRDDNFNLPDLPKSTIVQTDAFRYFTRTNRTYDLIISEPSNPWVVGVENLFTPEFYSMAVDRLNPGGIFFQWLQVYEIDNSVLAGIVENVAVHFEHVYLYTLGQYDLGIIASNDPLERPHVARRLAQPQVQRVLAPMDIDEVDMLAVLQTFQTQQVRSFALSSERVRHRMERPWLGHAAGRARFLLLNVRLNDPKALAGTSRHLIDDEERREALRRMVDKHEHNLSRWCSPSDPVLRHSTQFVCDLLEAHTFYHNMLHTPIQPARVGDMLSSYHHMREMGFITADIAMLDRVRDMIPEVADMLSTEDMRSVVLSLALEYAFEEEWDSAREVLTEAREHGIFREEDYRHAVNRLFQVRIDFDVRMALLAQWDEIMK